MIIDFTEQQIKDIDEYIEALTEKYRYSKKFKSEIREEAFEENDDYTEIISYINENMEEDDE